MELSHRSGSQCLRDPWDTLESFRLDNLLGRHDESFPNYPLCTMKYVERATWRIKLHSPPVPVKSYGILILLSVWRGDLQSPQIWSPWLCLWHLAWRHNIYIYIIFFFNLCVISVREERIHNFFLKVCFGGSGRHSVMIGIVLVFSQKYFGCGSLSPCEAMLCCLNVTKNWQHWKINSHHVVALG